MAFGSPGRHVEDLRDSWRRMNAIRWPWAIVVIATAVTSLMLLAQVLQPDAAGWISEYAFAVLPLASGLMLAVAGIRSNDKGRWAWITIGAGAALWGAGETIWEWYALILETEPPYPGLADVFYVLGYPAIFTGVLLIPRARVRRWQRIRMTLDMLAGMVALSGVTWVLYLSEIVYFDPEAGSLERIVNLAYPMGDLFLLMGVMILATRKTTFRFDGTMLALGVAMVLITVGDIAYAIASMNESYIVGGRLDAMWLIGYGLFGFSAVLIGRPQTQRAESDQQMGGWQIAVPYSAIVALLVLALERLDGPLAVLQGCIATVTMLVLARQAVALKETRQLVERQRDDLLSSISHELRTPITAMAGFTELLRADPDMDSAERVEIVEIIAQQTGQLGRIAGDLVEVARDQLEHTDLVLAEVDVDHLVRSSIDAVSGRVATESITVDVAPDLLVTGDKGRLRQVIVNFLTNADRYGGDRVLIVARAVRDQVVIEVHDDGHGVPDKHVSRIWSQWDRGEHSKTSAIQGSGLGLAIVQQLIAAHGGESGYRRSPLLGGACFWISVPEAGPATHTTLARHGVPAT